MKTLDKIFGKIRKIIDIVRNTVWYKNNGKIALFFWWIMIPDIIIHQSKISIIIFIAVIVKGYIKAYGYNECKIRLKTLFKS